MTLRPLPADFNDLDALSAALALAAAGYFVFPVKGELGGRDSKAWKEPLPGLHWDEASTRDPKQIAAWFAGTSGRGIGVDCAKSGLVVLDEDRPGILPAELLTPTLVNITGRADGGRHHVYQQPPGRRIGCRTGRLPKGFGEVKGAGGYVIFAPSPHPAGRSYRLEDPTVAPAVLPPGIAGLLPDRDLTEGAATSDEVEAFLIENVAGSRPGLLNAVVAKADRDVADGAGRHPTAVSMACWAVREAAAGFYPAGDVYERLGRWFAAATAEDREVLAEEWPAIFAWAVGQLDGTDLDQVRTDVEKRAAAWDRQRQADQVGVFGGGDRPSPSTAAGPAQVIVQVRPEDRVLPDGHPATDLGNAARFVALVDGRARYVPVWGKWIVHQDGRWIVDYNDTAVGGLAHGVPWRLRQLAVELGPQLGKDERNALWKWADRSAGSGAITGMIRQARSMAGMSVSHDQLDADPWLLNVENGTVDLGTGLLRPHNPDDLLTMQAPVRYDPTARAPLWERCLNRWQPDPEVRAFLQRAVGSGIVGVPVERLFVNVGRGGNGKSKFFGAIMSTLGPYAVVPHKSLFVAQRHEQHATVVASLFRARLLVAPETSQGDRLDEESIKNLTGGDLLRARRMREDEWSFQPTHTAFLHTNYEPRIVGTDLGIWRRMAFIRWHVTIPEWERDEWLAGRLQAEAPGILNWLIRGALEFANRGLADPAVVRAATDAYRQDQDHLGRFLADRCQAGPGLWVTARQLRQTYVTWCATEGEEPMSARAMGLELPRRGFQSGKRHHERVWLGLTVNAGNLVLAQ